MRTFFRYFSLLIIFVIPLDVSSTIYSACSNTSDSLATVTQNSTTTELDLSVSNSTPSTPSGVAYTDNITSLPHLNISTTSFPPEPLSSTAHSLKKRATAESCPPPSSLLPDGTLLSLWRVVYWTSQLLTWIVLPLMQSFSQASHK